MRIDFLANPGVERGEFFGVHAAQLHTKAISRLEVDADIDALDTIDGTGTWDGSNDELRHVLVSFIELLTKLPDKLCTSRAGDQLFSQLESSRVLTAIDDPIARVSP